MFAGEVAMKKNKRGAMGGIVASAALALLAFALLAVVAPAMRAQQQAIGAPPFYMGIYVTPVAGIPLSGVAQAEATQTLPDGNSFDRKRIERMARDSRGRIYNEGHQNVPLTSAEQSPLMIIHIYDPDTGMNVFLNPYNHVARQKQGAPHWPHIPPLNWAQVNSTFTPPGEPVRLEDLGASQMLGVDVHGYRRSVTLTEKVSGTPQPVVVTDEYWYSEDLRLNMMIKHKDPRTGTLTVTVTKLDRLEPPAELFEVPTSYKLVDMTPPEQGQR
jgi:hypothetical protein